MCNGHSDRASTGGTIAILKPTPTPGRPPLKRELSFRLNQDASTGTTTAAIDGFDSGKPGDQVIIQYVNTIPLCLLEVGL